MPHDVRNTHILENGPGNLADAEEVMDNYDALWTALDAKAAVAQQTWQTVALAGATWTPANLSFIKDTLGFVHIRPETFTMSGSTIAAGTTLATLPVAHRPGVTSFLYAHVGTSGIWTSGSVVVPISVSTAGLVKNEQSIATTGILVFSGIPFRAEN